MENAVVQPLLKKLGLELIKSNYRPISNLTFMSKIIEKCMLHQLNIHCETCNLLPAYQLAYCENYSCETCLLQLTTDILWAFEHQSTICSVLGRTMAQQPNIHILFWWGIQPWQLHRESPNPSTFPT